MIGRQVRKIVPHQITTRNQNKDGKTNATELRIVISAVARQCNGESGSFREEESEDREQH